MDKDKLDAMLERGLITADQYKELKALEESAGHENATPEDRDTVPDVDAES